MGELVTPFDLTLLSYLTLSQPLHLSVFTLDEFEAALRHTVIEQPCALLAEIHSTLIYNLRTVNFNRHSATLSLLKRKETFATAGQDVDVASSLLGIKIDDLLAAMADVGNNWERVPLRFSEGRHGWEEALIGCLKDVRLFRFVRSCRLNLALSLARYYGELPKNPMGSDKALVCSCRRCCRR